MLGRPIPRCATCGEEATHDTASSLFGKVHRYGPTDHPFIPAPATCEAVWAADLATVAAQRAAKKANRRRATAAARRYIRRPLRG